MSEDKIATALNMRPLDEAKEDLRAEFEEHLEKELNDHAQEVNKRTLPANSTNEETEMLPVERKSTELTITEALANENLQDIELARKNIENIISLGDDAVKEMVSIAKQSESPRAFEVVSQLMKTLLDANKDYVDMSTKKRYAKEEQAPSTQVTNNNLIVSTADLLKMIKDSGENG